MNDCPGLLWQAGQNPAYRPARTSFSFDFSCLSFALFMKLVVASLNWFSVPF